MSVETETIREQRNAERRAKAAKLRARADRLERQAETLCADYNHYSQDLAWITQPALPNSRFGKRRNKIRERYNRGLQLYQEVDRIREFAKHLELDPTTVLADAAARRQAQADAIDKLVTVGCTVHSHGYGNFTVIKINRETYTVRHKYGTMRIAKHLIDSVVAESREEESEE